MTSTYDGRIHSEGLIVEESEDTECASVVVSGLSAQTTKDAIQMYFENVRRSHGGDVKSVELNNGHAVVTFESPEVTKTVLEWGKHTLDDCLLTVTKPMPPKKSPPSNEDEDIEQPVQRSRIVRVMGISDKTTKDALLNFFENTRRSGGGEIEDIQHIPEERLADITFCSPDDAERVSEKKVVELDGSKLTLTLKEIAKEIPKDPYKLHVVGISEKTTKDGLVSFMEVVSQEEVDSIIFGSNSNAMVTFKEPPDLGRVHKKSSTRALDGSHLKIEQVNICDCIEVTGLAPNTTKDTVFYYFDNPRNGGGEVKNAELDSDDTRALVFFEDPSVVDLVIKGKHKINEAKLHVVPFYPFLGDSSADPGGGKKERVIKVNPQAVEFIYKFARQEFDRLLKERRVKYTWHQDSKEIILGCPEPKMDKRAWENSCEAVVAFINQIVSEKITVSPEAWGDMCIKAKEKCSSSNDVVAITCKEKECSFTLTGKKRDVSVLSEQLNDLKTEIEKQLEFEKNKISQSIGLTEAQLQLLSLTGFMEDLQARYKDLEVELSKKDGTIKFKGPDVVVKEVNITVWQTLSRITELVLELPKPIVAVVGSQPGKVYIAAKLNKENIDAVVNCDPNCDNHLLVTAVDRKDAIKAAALVKDLTSEQNTTELGVLYAERVSEKLGLELDGSNLTLTLKEIPKETPKDPYKVQVVGISEKATKDGIVLFMEVVSQEEVDSIIFGSNSNAVVTFKEPPDIERVHKRCSTRALDGSHLKIEQVNICDCIEVTGLAPNTTKDTVFYYFDNPRNGGGVVKNVELDSDDTRALVFFEDPSVVDLVIKGKHKISGAKLQVVPFYPFLGDSSADPGGGKKERIIKVNPQAIEFINKFARQEFDGLLEERRVKYTWHQDSKEIILGCPEPKMDKRAWENSCEAVVVYINQIVSEKITVSPEAWGDMCKRAKEKCSSFKDVVAITCKEKECSFTLTGKKRDVSVLSEQLNDLKTEIEKQLEFEKNKVSQSIGLSEAQLQLLSLTGFVEDLQARYKDLEVELSKKDGTINFKGPDVVVREVSITVWQTLSRIKERDLDLPKPIVAVVGSQPGKVYIATKLNKENIDAFVNSDPISDNHLVVTAVDRKHAKKAADLVKDLTSEQGIHLDDHQKRLMKSEKWNQLKRSIRQSMLLEVREDLAASTLWIAGIKEEVDHALEKVDEFCEENIILDQVINAESGRLKFIFRCKKDTIQSLEKSLAKHSVKITKETYESSKVSALVVNGTRDGIQLAVTKVQKLLKEIKERKVDLDKPGMKKFFSQKKGMNLLSIVENDHECVIERCTAADSRQSFSRSESTRGDKSSNKPMNEVSEDGANLFHREDKMWLQVYAESDRTLSKAESDIHKLMEENCKVKDMENKAIGKLSEAQRNWVMKMEATHDVKIQIDKRINRIVIRGVSEDVYNTISAIYEILNESAEEEHFSKYAELLSRNIQWYYEDGDNFEPYDEKTNAKIEHAYQDNETRVLILVQEEEEDELTTYEIDLAAMIEKNADTGESARVDRRDKTKGIALPSHWDHQPKDRNGKEEELHMVVLDPAKHKKEYDEVKGAMQKTIPGVNIIKIERVQNPGLYRTYAVKKQKMDDQNGGNEKKLFHGTSPETCKLINQQGFNRSFCGKNATALGKGVYFARDASYSASSTYSPPDSAGNRYMYLASVLAGQYTQGHRDMITPPAKDPNNAAITYDTLVDNVLNPSIFVVFYDTQNCPDYLITFR